MRRWRRPPTRRLIRIAGPGTGRRPRRARMRMSRRSWSGLPGRAQDRGGLAAAAAFLERAALLTPEPGPPGAAAAGRGPGQREAGELDAALGLLVAAEAGPLDALQAAQVERLRGQIASDQRRGSDAARLLLRAARLLEPLDAGLARETHLEAIWAAMFAGDLGLAWRRAGGGRGRARRAARSRPAARGRRPARRVRAAVHGGIRGRRAGADPGT